MADAALLLATAQKQASDQRAVRRVLLSGSEGVGRTHHLLQLADRSPALVRIECSLGRAPAQLLRALSATTGTHDEHVWLHLQHAPALAALEPERKQLAIELLLSLLGVSRADFRTQRLDEDARREGAFLELTKWVTERARTDGLVLAFDDAHRCDDDGVALIELLAQQDSSMTLVLIVSHDSDAARWSPAFQARHDAWAAEPRWQRIEVRPPGDRVLIDALVGLGAPQTSAEALNAHAKGNPSLALGLWRFWQSQPDLPASALPATLNALRVARVKLLGEDVARAMTTLAVLRGVAPLAALSAIDAGVPLMLQRAEAAELVVFERRGPLEVCQFADSRVMQSLASAVSSTQSLGILVTAGTWAAETLEHLDLPAFELVADVLVPLAEPALENGENSLWLEAWANIAHSRAEALLRLEAALEAAHGVRRLVVLRRLAELKLFLGRAEEAVASLQAVTRAGVSNRAQPQSRALELMAAQSLTILDRWSTLSADEALLALDIARGECLSHLLRRDETERVFLELEKRLSKLSGGASTHLWVRWARAWSWFLCEILGRAADAVKACAMVRHKVGSSELLADEDALGLVRAQEIASVSVGDFGQARQLADELIALAERNARLRDLSLAWNARAILHFGQGELPAARQAFEKAIQLARTTAWSRREAISSHNLALVLTELGEFDLAQAMETHYVRLSVLIGNHAAKAEAPLVFANIDLSQGNMTQADAHLTTARKFSENNGWAMMMAAIRSLSGRLRLLRFRSNGDALELTRAKNDFLAALEVLEEHSTAWTEELDPGEVYALYAATLKLNRQPEVARQTLARAIARTPKDNVVSQQQLAVACAYVDDGDLESSLQWFIERQFERRVSLWRLLYG